MRISLNWLRRYIEWQDSPEDLARKLTMVGLEVETIEKPGERYDRFVIGEVLDVQKHPNAKKLTVCKVDVGAEHLQIVCGAPNVMAGQKVAVGLSGAVVPRNQHDPNGAPFTLGKVMLRGVESSGMICSAYELDMGEDKDGILVLREDVAVGMPLTEFLGLTDTIFEVGITPNRVDAMSHLGIAREVGALSGHPLEIPPTEFIESGRNVAEAAKVMVENTEACPRYTARVIMNIKVGPSPQWMQELLTSAGVRPINNIVDVTNFVLMECGHPLHAFDYDLLADHTIIVRNATEGETFRTLDHVERKLTKENLMICDAQRPVAIAGVMGGENSEISEKTMNVLLESAYFDPRSVRRTSKKHGLSTDASQRFERGADPNVTKWAVERAVSLIQQLAGGDVLPGVLDVYPTPIAPKQVSLRPRKTNQVLGTNLVAPEITALLKKIGITLAADSPTTLDAETLLFQVPTFRPDIEREIDLIEEVARIFGYDNIETNTRVSLSLSDTISPPDETDDLRDWFVGRGFREIVVNSMQEESRARIASDYSVKVANPISKDMSALRTSLVTPALEIIRTNIAHGVKDLRLFELGRVYFSGGASSNTPNIVGEYVEEDRLLLAISGKVSPFHWDMPVRSADLFDLKGEVESFFEKIFLDNIKFIPYSTPKALTEDALSIEIHGEIVGTLGKVASEILRQYEIEQDVFVAELIISTLVHRQRREKRYTPVSSFPPVLRDLAIVVEDTVPVASLEEDMRDTGGGLLRKVQLFDLYRGAQLAGGKKSCAFALEFSAEDRTLSQEEIDVIIQKIIARLSAKYSATLRI